MKPKLDLKFLLVRAMAFGIGITAEAGALPEKKVAVDVNGNPLPAGAVARLGSVSLYHENGHKVAYSGDGNILASSGGRVIRLWDPATGRDRGQFPGDRGFALSPDGSRLAADAAFDQGLVLIWDTRSGKELHRLSGHQGEVFALAFSPDGKQLASGARDGTIRLWNAVTGKQERLLAENKGYTSALAFSRDGKTLFSGEYLPGADGRVQNAGKDCMTRLWDATTGQERRRFPGQAFVALSADGGVMATASEKTNVLHLVNWITGETLLTLKNFPGEGIPGDVNSACFSADGKFIAIACRRDSAIRLWDTKSGKEARSIPLAGYAFSVACSPDGKTLAVGVPWGLGHDRIRLFDPATGEERVASPNLMDEFREIRFFPDGKTLASTSADKTFRLWQPNGGKELRVVRFGIEPWAMSPDGTAVAIHAKREPTRIGNLIRQQEEVVELWDTTTSKVRHRLKHDGQVAKVAWSPDGALVAISTEQGHLYLWNAATGEFSNRWNVPAATAIVFSPDGKTLATGDDFCTVKLWQVTTGRLIRQLGESRTQDDRFPAATSIVAFSPDGKSIASAITGQRLFVVWDASSGKQLTICEIRSDWQTEAQVYAIAFSADSKTVFSGGADRAVHQWDAATGKELLQLPGHRGDVRSLAISADGSRLASSSTDCTILIWDLASLTKKK